MAYQIEGIEHGAGRKFCIGSQYFSQIDLEDVRQNTKRYVPRVRLVKGDPNYVPPISRDQGQVDSSEELMVGEKPNLVEPQHGELSNQPSLGL